MTTAGDMFRASRISSAIKRLRRQVFRRERSALKSLTRLLWLLPALSCSGCSLHFDSGDYGSLVQMTQLAYISAPQDLPAGQVAEVPYASLGYRIGDGPEHMLVLENSTREPWLWTDGHRIAILTAGGHITHTTGFKHNIDSMEMVQTERGPDGNMMLTWMARLEDMPSGPVMIRCTQHLIDDAPIAVLGVPIETRETDETCQSLTPSVKWNFTNRYWISNQTGFIWKAEQNIHPAMKPVTYEILRPPEY